MTAWRKHGHRLLGLVGPLRGGHPRARSAGESRQAGVAAGPEKRLLSAQGLAPVVVRARTLPGVGGSGQVLHVASHLPESQVRLAEARAIARELGMRLDQRLTHRQGALAGGERLVEPPRPAEHVRRVGLAVRQGIPVLGGCRAGSASFCRIASSRV